MTEGLGALGNALFRGAAGDAPDAAKAAGLVAEGAASPVAAFRAASGAQIKKAHGNYQSEWLHLTSANPSAELDLFVLPQFRSEA